MVRKYIWPWQKYFRNTSLLRLNYRIGLETYLFIWQSKQLYQMIVNLEINDQYLFLDQMCAVVKYSQLFHTRRRSRLSTFNGNRQKQTNNLKHTSMYIYSRVWVVLAIFFLKDNFDSILVGKMIWKLHANNLSEIVVGFV